METGTTARARIAALNAWIKAYAAREHLIFVDYYAALNDGAGGTNATYSKDGVHPNPPGYAVMDALAETAIRQALR